MNIVLTGATGFVGGEVLAQLLDHPTVRGVTCLTRRPIARSHPKLTALVHSDFAAYDDDVVTLLADHHACIWTLGGKASDFEREADYERVTHTFTLAFARAMAARVRPFSFSYLSGMGADPTESARFSWERTTRHLKGRTEKDLAVLASSNADFTAYAFRPGGILPKTAGRLVSTLLAPLVVRVDTLAKAMIHVAIQGHSRPTIGNDGIRHIARS